MELCTGGSLYEVIDSPENAYGVTETEFKQVIYDVGEFFPHLPHATNLVCIHRIHTHTHTHTHIVVPKNNMDMFETL